MCKTARNNLPHGLHFFFLTLNPRCKQLPVCLSHFENTPAAAQLLLTVHVTLSLSLSLSLPFIYDIRETRERPLLFISMKKGRPKWKKQNETTFSAHEGFAYLLVVPAFPTPYSFNVTFFLPFGLRPFFILLQLNCLENYILFLPRLYP
jgi:hypothetical protein